MSGFVELASVGKGRDFSEEGGREGGDRSIFRVFDVFEILETLIPMITRTGRILT